MIMLFNSEGFQIYFGLDLNKFGYWECEKFI